MGLCGDIFGVKYVVPFGCRSGSAVWLYNLNHDLKTKLAALVSWCYTVLPSMKVNSRFPSLRWVGADPHKAQLLVRAYKLPSSYMYVKVA